MAQAFFSKKLGKLISREAPKNSGGYTLVEILGAFFIMSIILTLVTGIFVENGRQRNASLVMMNEGLSAAATLEQITADLEGALLLQAQSGRPDENPWRFLAEGTRELGASTLRFVTQNAPLSNRGEHPSGWVEVAYFLDEDRDGGVELWRWLSPRPPTNAGARFPEAGDQGTQRLAVGIDDLGFRFLDSEGEWLDEWDSAYQPPGTPLPGSVEINLRRLREARQGETEDESNLVPGRLHTRRVTLPMQSLDIEALVALGQGNTEEDAGCFSVADCLAEGDTSWYEDEIESDCNGDDRLCELLSDSDSTCWSEILDRAARLADLAPAACGP